MKYFSPTTDPLLYACGCSYHDCVASINPRLPEVLDVIREMIGAAMIINSGPRCVTHNIDIGGANYSEHIDGDGVDVSCTTSRLRFLIVRAALEVGINRIGIGKTFIHLGISTTNDNLVMWVY